MGQNVKYILREWVLGFIGVNKKPVGPMIYSFQSCHVDGDGRRLHAGHD